MEQLKKMNVYQKFTTLDEAKGFLKQLEKEDAIKMAALKSLKLSYIKPGTPASYIYDECDDSQVDELFSNGGFTLETDDGDYLVNPLSLFTLLDRAGIKSRFQAKLSDERKYEKLCDLVNFTWDEYNKETLLLIRGGYVIAAHSQNYKILPQSTLFEDYLGYLINEYPTVEFICGSYSHEFTHCSFKLSTYKDELFDSYREAWAKAGYDEEILKSSSPCVDFQTSDIGMSTFTITPLLVNKNRYYNLGEKLQVKHCGIADVSIAQKLYPLAFAAIKEGADNIAELINLEVEYPIASMVRIMKTLGFVRLAKKACEDVLSNFKSAMEFNDCVTGFDIYSAICDIEDDSHFAALSSSTKLKIQENMCRILKLNWNDIDRAGEETL